MPSFRSATARIRTLSVLAALALSCLSPAVVHAAPASPPPDVKAASCLYEIQAEAYRFARLQREVVTAKSGSDVVGRLRSQMKASTQELMLNLKEAQPGLKAAGQDRAYKALEEAIADYLAEAATSGGDPQLLSLRGKQASLMKVVEQARQGLQAKINPKVAGSVGLIGGAKAQVERLAHDFEFCDTRSCQQLLTSEASALDRNIEDLKSQMERFFPRNQYELAHNQMVFIQMAVAARLRAGLTPENQNHMIIAAGHLWEVLDVVLDGYTEKGSSG